MANKKTRRLLQSLKDFLTPLQAPRDFLGPILEPYSSQRQRSSLTTPRQVGRNYVEVPVPSDDEVSQINRDRLERAKLDQDKEALDLNLRSQHKIIVATLITAMVALISAVLALFIALHSKPPVVYVQPNIINKSPIVDVKPNIIVPKQ
jgi:hypothetical protein